MTGLERMIQKVTNATAQALNRGDRGPGFSMSTEAWSLEELRRAALEDEERRFEAIKRTRRRMLRYSCE